MNEQSPNQDASVREQLSAFLDDELPTDEARFLLRRLQSDPTLTHHLARYALIGEALRNHGEAPGADLARRVRAQLTRDGGTRAAADPVQFPAQEAAAPMPDGPATAAGATPPWTSRLLPIGQVAAASAVAAILLFAVAPRLPTGTTAVTELAGGEPEPQRAAVADPSAVTPVSGTDLGLVDVSEGADFAGYLLRHSSAINPVVRPDYLGAQQAYDYLRTGGTAAGAAVPMPVPDTLERARRDGRDEVDRQR